MAKITSRYTKNSNNGNVYSLKNYRKRLELRSIVPYISMVISIIALLKVYNLI